MLVVPQVITRHSWLYRVQRVRLEYLQQLLLQLSCSQPWGRSLLVQPTSQIASSLTVECFGVRGSRLQALSSRLQEHTFRTAGLPSTVLNKAEQDWLTC